MVTTINKSGTAADTSAFRSAAARHVAALILLPLLVLGGRGAMASQYCVGTVGELDTALNDAASASTALFTTTIHLKQGTYHVGSSRMTQLNHAYFNTLELLGGYNSDCSARTVNPDNTVFDADASALAFFASAARRATVPTASPLPTARTTTSSIPTRSRTTRIPASISPRRISAA